MIQYIGRFAELNPHLYRGNRPQYPRDNTHTAQRNPPTILIRETEVRQAALIHGFSDALYAPHTLWFPNQTYETASVHIFTPIPTILNVKYLWSSEYFHFLTEALPNALLLHDRYPGSPVCVLESKFAVEAFRWFGIQSPILFSNPPRLSKQAFATYVECGNPSKQKINRLRAVVESKLSFERTHGILIRRHRTRELLNEAEVLEFFQTTYPELKWVVFDSLSFADTAGLFSKADMIVGPHGAGFTNMLFAPRGVRIVECMPLADPNLCYWHLSEMLGHSYSMIPIPCDGTGSMRVSIDELRMLIKRPT